MKRNRQNARSESKASGGRGEVDRAQPAQPERGINPQRVPLVERFPLPDDLKRKPVRDVHQEERLRGSDSEVMSFSFEGGSDHLEGDVAPRDRDHGGHNPTDHASTKTA